jgi:hypothetical protein
MKKIIRITENEFFKIIDSKKDLFEQESSPKYVEHWEGKFEKSAEILIKMGYDADNLKKRIDYIMITHFQGKR